MSDLAEHPFLASILSTARNVATIAGSGFSAVVDAISRNSRFIATTPSAHRFLHSAASSRSWLAGLFTDREDGTRPFVSSMFGRKEAEPGPSFRGTPEEVQAHYSRQWYLGGARCVPGHGAPRRTEVVLECGMHAAITDAVETQVCVILCAGCV